MKREFLRKLKGISVGILTATILSTSVAANVAYAAEPDESFITDCINNTVESMPETESTAITPCDASIVEDTSDTGALDETLPDAEVSNTEVSDAEVSDAEVPDTEVSDTEVSDTEVSDTETSNTEVSDTEVSDTETPSVETPEEETPSEEAPSEEAPESPNETPDAPEVTPEVPDEKIPDEKNPDEENTKETVSPIEPVVWEFNSALADSFKNVPNWSGTWDATKVIRFSENLSTEKFIAEIGEQARKIGQDHDIYASVMIAQAILESGSGNSSLSRAPYNNLFGIKGSYKGESVTMATKEDDGTGNLYTIDASFRKYETVKESLEDYANLLTKDMGKYYSGAWKENAETYKEAAMFLEGRYATDTGYAEKLVSLIELYDLTRFDNPPEYVPADENIDMTQLAAEVTSHLGTPYLWGGTTPDGFDCSGLVQYCYKKALNIDISRVTYDQQYEGEAVAFDDLMLGDLLFFNETGNDTHHVAMYLGDGCYIHAPKPGECVKITAMEEYMPTFARRIVPVKAVK